MSADDSTIQPSSRALEVFSNFLTEVETGHPASFTKLLARHPELADELRKLNGPGAPTEPGGVLAMGSTQRLVNSLREKVTSSHRYLVRGEVGRGAMGIIYRVWDREIRRHIAMKVLRPAVDKDIHAGNSEAEQMRLARFLDEAQITGQLDHASIVPLHELGMDDKGRVFFTMKLVRGGDLKSVFDNLHKGEDGWTLNAAVQVLQRVCEAIAFAHAKGVIHRDLKPSNIMVGPFGEVYVMDWGLARSLDRADLHDVRLQDRSSAELTAVTTTRGIERMDDGDTPLLTMDGSVVGTPAYIPPEQAIGRVDQIGPRSDVYSLGAMLYHLLAGHIPYVRKGATMSQYTLLSLVMSGPPPPVAEENTNIPRELAAICEKAMARDIDARYANASDLAADLAAFLERRPVAAQTPTFAYILKLAVERNRGIFMTAAAGLLLLVVSTVWFLFHLSAERDKTARLADASSARALLAELRDLRPLSAANIRETERWLQRADLLFTRESDYLEHSGGSLAPLDDDEVTKLRGRIATLRASRAEIATNLNIAKNLRAESVDREQTAWNAAIESIVKNPKYNGLRLSPQTGLVPLGADAHSGLYEFWCMPTGERPRLDAASGKLFNPRSGIVFVLLPGGEFDMGSPEDEEGHLPNEDVARRAVRPFFISKFETTQAQWMQLMGDNPSEFAAGTTYKEQSFTEAHPVESVTWDDARKCTNRADLRLPTETEWEYACRAGSTTPYPWGEDYNCLRARENTLDGGVPPSLPGETRVPWNDGYIFHAPAGSFAPNGFGLFDMLGNVAEWCDSPFCDNYKSDKPDAHFIKFKTFRGGSWFLSPTRNVCRSAFRQYSLPNTANKTLGFRAARSVDP
ncbi:MAG: SUMF1/EgtB/PvdO family nonheme iron enzyme [Planctomycetes bacterium]|nr:SUMF1/EgtB/PvdO family nonheme iron enzyme [Planctomycetota bacterium]